METDIRPIIGLEVHVELKTESKMFCACSTDHFGKKPNTQTCPVCLGLPGALPFPNQKAIEATMMVGLAVNCRINKISRFDRKNYFYPDLPKGYQISQYDAPLAHNGKWQMANGKWLRIKRVHLEEDTGKLIHQKETSLIDFNRSGVPLMEIVTEPDITSTEEAKEFLQNLQQLVRYLNVSEADMEKGQMRCEPTVNLEITKDGKTIYTPLVELKNINSFRFVQKAIDYELKRQREEYDRTAEEKGERNKTTRGWNEAQGATVLQREKEEAEDYRYFPEPDIPPLKFTDEQIEAVGKRIPELPRQRKERFISIYGLTEAQTQASTATVERADFFEEVVKEGKKVNLEPGVIANWIINKRTDAVSPEALVSEILAKTKVSNLSESELKNLAEKAVKANQKAVADYQKGRIGALEFLVGQVVRLSQGLADPTKTKEVLKNLLDKT